MSTHRGLRAGAACAATESLEGCGDAPATECPRRPGTSERARRHSDPFSRGPIPRVDGDRVSGRAGQGVGGGQSVTSWPRITASAKWPSTQA
jgi:hypothetical protein